MKRLIATISVIISVVALALLVLQAAAAPVAPTTIDEIVYDDATTWDNWSWGTEADFANTAPVFTGTNSISVTYTGQWAALSLYRPVAALDGDDVRSISLQIYGGEGGTRVGIYTQDNANTDSPGKPIIDAPAGEWTAVTVSMADLGNPAQIRRVNVQDQSGLAAPRPVFYVDEIKIAKVQDLVLTKSVVPSADVEPGDTVTYTLTVQNPNAEALAGIVITDVLPADLGDVTFVAGTAALPAGNTLVWPSFDLGASGTVDLVFTAQVGQDPAETISNTASCTYQFAATTKTYSATSNTAVFTTKAVYKIFLPVVAKNV
ncbi:MAG: DUF11 domain-containing protein [Thermoflexales bacterium]|nr:DUF11 domain-containing protein [Thermoflexales bacterium]